MFEAVMCTLKTDTYGLYLKITSQRGRSAIPILILLPPKKMSFSWSLQSGEQATIDASNSDKLNFGD